MPTTIISVDSVLAQMQQMASLAAAHTPAAVSVSSGHSTSGAFAAELLSAVRNVAAAQQHAVSQARHFELGTPGVALNDVMIDMQKASIGFQSLVQVRNKLVSAYQTIANMPI